MSNHIHFLASLPEDKDVVQLLQRIKTNSANRLKPLLDTKQREALQVQETLNRHSFWQRSFRSVVIDSTPARLTKFDYIHGNPVRAGLAESPEQYRWSSAHALANDCVDEYGHLDVMKAHRLYRAVV